MNGSVSFLGRLSYCTRRGFGRSPLRAVDMSKDIDGGLARQDDRGTDVPRVDIGSLVHEVKKSMSDRPAGASL